MPAQYGRIAHKTRKTELKKYKESPCEQSQEESSALVIFVCTRSVAGPAHMNEETEKTWQSSSSWSTDRHPSTWLTWSQTKSKIKQHTIWEAVKTWAKAQHALHFSRTHSSHRQQKHGTPYHNNWKTPKTSTSSKGKSTKTMRKLQHTTTQATDKDRSYTPEWGLNAVL